MIRHRRLCVLKSNRFDLAEILLNLLFECLCQDTKSHMCVSLTEDDRIIPEQLTSYALPHTSRKNLKSRSVQLNLQAQLA